MESYNDFIKLNERCKARGLGYKFIVNSLAGDGDITVVSENLDTYHMTIRQYLEEFFADIDTDKQIHVKNPSAIKGWKGFSTCKLQKPVTKKWVLIEVVERDISIMQYSTKKEAQEAMNEAFMSSDFDVESKVEDGDAEIGDMSAWITEGNNHDNYDWKIVELE